MRVLHVFNYHRSSWGSDIAWDQTIRLSQERGIETGTFSRDSKALSGLGGKARAFAGGLYCPEGVRGFSEALAAFRPDLVHTHELYPLISPWILPRSTAAGIPVVQSTYDYRFTCPIATHFSRGEVCRRCVGGREYWAVLRNCRDSRVESLAYTLRNVVARKFRLFHDHISQFLVPTEFSRQWLMRDAGVPPERITIQPCAIALPANAVDPARGGYVAYAGRFSPEKGAEVLIAAARLSGLPVRLAGRAESHPAIRPGDNIQCVPQSQAQGLDEFYRGARMLVVPSLWEETFSVVAAEAMSHGLPVIAARIGALPHTVQDEKTGLLFEPGNAEQLAALMRRLWDDPALCRRLGSAGRERVRTEFSAEMHVSTMLSAYEDAVAKGVPRSRKNEASDRTTSKTT
jgi:glycosyltransferase involved in cell wall biosynthesis